MTHCSQAAIALPVIAVAVATSSLAWGIFLLALQETLVVLLLPRIAAFRRHVDERLHRVVRLDAACARAALLVQMSDEHRRELRVLEDLVGRIRALGGVAEDTDEEWLGLDGLLASYVRLAIAHRASEQAFAATDDTKLALEIAELEILRATRTGENRLWTERRLALLCDRRATLAKARIERGVLAEKLATTGQLVRWTHEELARARSADVQADLADALAHCVRNTAALRDVAAIVGSVEVAPETLRLGRGMLLPAAEPAPTVAIQG